MKKKHSLAFTLAEVLITLTIVGVIAALTIPSLIAKHEKSKAEAGVKKFYSIINQAVKLSAIDNGPVDEWVVQGKSYNKDEMLSFVKKYFLPYLKYQKVEVVNGTYPTVKITLNDGSLFSYTIDGNGGDIKSFLDGNTKNTSTYNCFSFQFNKRISETDRKIISQDAIETYSYGYNGDTNYYKTSSQFGCNMYSHNPYYCTKVIQLNGWKIPDDYPKRTQNLIFYGL